jgi:hypothetical protein
MFEPHYLKFRSGQFQNHSKQTSVAFSKSKTEKQKTKRKENRSKKRV